MASAPKARPRDAATAPVAPVLAWVDGEAVDPAAPHVSLLDRGFTLADGVFETLRLYGGIPFRADRHLARLRRGARVLRLPLPPSLDAMLHDAVAGARAAGLRDASLRLTVTRGVGAPGLAPPPDAAPTTAIVVQRVHAAPPPTLAVVIARARRNERSPLSEIKALAYTESVVALLEARAADADDAIFLDTEGHAAEATASNVFVVRSGTLITPPPSCGVLAGITREAVLDIARTTAVPTEERPLGADELRAADELFLTSSIREIAPVLRVEGVEVGAGRVGPLTSRLQAEFGALVRRECTP